jgi:hypothetical protein
MVPAAVVSTVARLRVYVESGSRRVFAGALDWPGWCRSGRDEKTALQALVDYGPRYVDALGTVAEALELPSDTRSLKVVERLEGDATTDFGAPGASPAADELPVDGADLAWLSRILEASWSALDAAAGSVSRRGLRAGPRGGGRDLRKILEHVTAADGGYMVRLGGEQPSEKAWSAKVAQDVRRSFTEALGRRARGEMADRGPRGGKRWSARYGARRSAWHALDHAWEIQDRSGTS